MSAGHASPSQPAFWWLRHDWVTYKTPISKGKVIVPLDFLVPGYVPDISSLAYELVHSRRDRRKIGDFSSWDDAAFFVNRRAYQTFEDMFTRHGRTYQVRCSHETHFIVLIDTTHDAIDLARSEYEVSDEDKDRITRMRKIVLKEGFDTSDDIFRLDRSFALQCQMIVSNRFKRRYEENGLTGLFFTAAIAQLH